MLTDEYQLEATASTKSRPLTIGDKSVIRLAASGGEHNKRASLWRNTFLGGIVMEKFRVWGYALLAAAFVAVLSFFVVPQWRGIAGGSVGIAWAIMVLYYPEENLTRRLVVASLAGFVAVFVHFGISLLFF